MISHSKRYVNPFSQLFGKRCCVFGSFGVYSTCEVKAVKELNYKEIAKRIADRREELELSLQDVADRTGLAKSTLQRYESGAIKRIPIAKLTALSAALEMSPNELIGIGTTEEIPLGFHHLPETYSVPRVGAIACGTPILAEQNIESYDAVPNRIRCDFTLVCKGDSMVGAGIEDGDVVYIRQQPEVENNEIAAVMIDGEATLKYFKRVGDMVLLSPANQKYEPIIVSGENLGKVKIVGKAVGFTRFFEK